MVRKTREERRKMEGGVERTGGKERRKGEEKETRRDGMIQAHYFRLLVVPLTPFFEAEGLPVGGTRRGNLIARLQLLNLHMQRKTRLLPCGTELVCVLYQCEHGLVGQVYGQSGGLHWVKPTLGTDLSARIVDRTFGLSYSTTGLYHNLNYKKAGHHGQAFLTTRF